jgi:aspartate/methionine/tyrosine aminotransferase
MDKYEDHARYNIAETCADSISLQQLQNLSESSESPMVSRETRMTYGEVKGLKTLRASIAELYSGKGCILQTYDAENETPPFNDDNVVITQGAIAANHLAFYSLVGPGDHVICHYPTYQQLYATPKSLGAHVDLWKASPEQRWIPSFEELRGLIRTNTKLILLKFVFLRLGLLSLTRIATRTIQPAPFSRALCSCK